MTADREDVVAEARRWLRTRFVHQARKAGIGCDCGGFAAGVAVELGLFPADFWATFDRDFGGYARTPSHGTLQRICERFLVPAAAPRLGSVVLMQFRAEPQHLGIVGDYRHGGQSLIHALERAGAVVEHRLSAGWQAYIVAAYDYPGVA